MTFSKLGLRRSIVERCEQMGYEQPTPIQNAAIPVILSGRDILACAETGTGKTAAFLLPILNKLTEGPKRPGIRVLILSPTRELANQTEEFCRKIAPKGITCAAIIGGSGYTRQMAALRGGANIVIATPGRLIDLMDQGVADLRGLTHLVLDEADRMLDMGFLPSIKRIERSLPGTRQTLLFSATFSQEIENIAYKLLTDPETIEVSPRGKAAELVHQTAYSVAPNSKMVLLLELLEKDSLQRVLVFTRTKRGADRLAHVLEKRSHSSNRIHGDRSQSQRDAALRSFKAGTTNVLVATDVAARGIDIDSVQHVINYDIPEAPEDYVHRIGRTGRAGNAGKAITIFTLAEEHNMRAIERLTGERVERIVHPDFGGHTAMASQPSFAGTKTAAGKSSVRSFGSRRRRSR